MYLWISLALVSATVYGKSRISVPDLKAVNFATALEGRKLNGRVINELEVDSEIACQFECVEEERCHSYNFGTTKNQAEKFKCQLSESDRFVGHANFTENDDFKYRGVLTVCEADSSICGDKEFCIPNYQNYSVRCKCYDGYIGKPCRPKSCFQLLQDGFTSSGVYTINPDGGKPIKVLCDMTTDGGGWTVFQRRLDGSVNFYVGWASYKNGFGNLNSEFWLGNDNLHRLTDTGDVMLRVDLEDFDGNFTYAEYSTFKVADEGDKYRLLIDGYKGTAGNSITGGQTAYNKQFTTKDQDNDKLGYNCAVRFKGAWWYNDCHWSNMNGQYLGGSHASFADGINWNTFRGYYYSLKRAEMKIRPKI